MKTGTASQNAGFRNFIPMGAISESLTGNF
jgi:hypothetical protein